jgi:hypothetical protein
MIAFLLEPNTSRDGNRQLSLWAFDLQALADIDFYPFRQGDGLLSYA